MFRRIRIVVGADRIGDIEDWLRARSARKARARVGQQEEIFAPTLEQFNGIRPLLCDAADVFDVVADSHDDRVWPSPDRIRYITRPALCLKRLSTNAAGQVVYQLKNLFRDGTTHMLFSLEDFIARLSALVPRPRVNLTRYHGVFAPSSPMRGAIVPSPASARRRRKLKDSASVPASLPCSSTESRSDCNDPPTAPLTWAQRLKRVFEIEIDITLCPRCGGMLRVIGDVTDPDLIRKILDHVDSRASPRLPPRRAESDTTHPNLFAGRQYLPGNSPRRAYYSWASRFTQTPVRQPPRPVNDLRPPHTTGQLSSSPCRPPSCLSLVGLGPWSW